MRIIQIMLCAAVLASCSSKPPVMPVAGKPPSKKQETPAETPKVEAPVKTPKAETPKAETPKVEAPKAETPVETPQAKTPVETPKSGCDNIDLNAIKAQLVKSCVKHSLPIEMPLVKGNLATEFIEPEFTVIFTNNVTIFQESALPNKGWETVLDDSIVENIARVQQMANLQRREVNDPMTVAVLASPNVPMSRINGVLKALAHHEITDITFLFDAGKPDISMFDPKIVAELRALKNKNPMRQQSNLAKYISSNISNCKPLQNTFSVLPMATPDTRCQLMAAGISEGLKECDCQADVQRLIAPLIMFQGKRIGTARVVIGQGAALSIKRKGTWKQNAPIIKAASGTTVAPFW